jgi:hypothetical protein
VAGDIPSVQLRELVEGVRRDYLASPTLSLTAPQGRRLWALDPERCRAALDVLVESGFLTVTREGRFVRATPARHERHA